MTFLAVCSFGVGSSLILKLSLDKALAKLGVSGESKALPAIAPVETELRPPPAS